MTAQLRTRCGVLLSTYQPEGHPLTKTVTWVSLSELNGDGPVTPTILELEAGDLCHESNSDGQMYRYGAE